MADRGNPNPDQIVGGQLGKNLGVNVGTLVGHTAVRYYVMGDECQKRVATDAGERAG